MDFSAKILADSTSSTGSRLVTMELTYPRCIHAEFMTHRMFSRNSSSSRAIPYETLRNRILENPFIPISWGKNQKGMQAGEDLEDVRQLRFRWITSLDDAIYHANKLHAMGLHKQIVNRLLEPWMWITVIATAIDKGWENFFHLRCHPDAEPHIQHIAYAARVLYDASESQLLERFDWHLPLIGFEGDDQLDRVKKIMVSVGRCARVSYLTHDGKRDVAADINLHDRLAKSCHWSPFEHVAQALPAMKVSNLGPHWHQYRKEFGSEMVGERRVNHENTK